MILTKLEPFTKIEIEVLKEQFGTYIKTVIDVRNEICSAGCERHFESEKILLEQESKQGNIWGGGIDLETMAIDFNSFINIRPQQENDSNEIQNKKIRKKYEELTKKFFKILYE